METGRVFRCLAHGLAAVLLATMGTACHSGAATDSAVRAAQGPSATAQATGLWDLAALCRVPRAAWGERKGLVQQVYYEGEPFQGKPTRVFAYYGRPAEGEGPFPAVLLVHGGGGKAFSDWAAHWAKRGYVSLAMDLAGHGPPGRLEDGGPGQDDAAKFRDFTDTNAKDMWTYHAVAAVIRGHSLLASRKEVNAKRVALTGISWGGYLTCIIAGLDDRLQAAVPVYGCGFIHENSCWVPLWFAKMSEATRRRVRWSSGTCTTLTARRRCWMRSGSRSPTTSLPTPTKSSTRGIGTTRRRGCTRCGSGTTIRRWELGRRGTPSTSMG